MCKYALLVFVSLLAGCATNPEAYDQQRQQEHTDHLRQNGI